MYSERFWKKFNLSQGSDQIPGFQEVLCETFEAEFIVGLILTEVCL
jgi:hypothetical protein